MDWDRQGRWSDDDRKMAARFETFADTPETKEPKKKKKKKQAASPASQPEAQQPAKKPETPEGDKEKTRLERLFEPPKPDQAESEPKKSDRTPSQKFQELSDPLEPLEATVKSNVITEDERRIIAQQLLAAHRVRLSQELEHTPDGQEQPTLTSAGFVHNLEEQIALDGTFDETVINKAATRTLEEFELLGPSEQDESLMPAETLPDDEHELTLSVYPAGAGKGGGARPPGGHMGMAGVAAELPASPNVYSYSPHNSKRTLHAAPEQTDTYPPKYQRGTDLLVGGIVGYLLGRRRGRVKTEQKLAPIRQSLKKQVKHLEQKLIISDQHIRRLTAQKVAAHPQEAPVRIIETMHAKRALARSPEQTVPYARSPERLGHLVVARPERTPETPRRGPETISQDVASLPLQRIIEAAAAITIAGTSVERLYRAGRLSSEGMRRVVQEHARGGSVERTLNRELKSGETHKITSPELLSAAQTHSGGSPAPAVTGQAAADPQAPPGAPLHPLSTASYSHLSDSESVAARQKSSPAAIVLALLLAIGIVLLLLALF